MTLESAVEFATESRVHIGLHVADRDRSIDFYRTLLGTEPLKVRPGYAKFELAEPPLNLSLNEHRGTGARELPASLHYGIQVKSTAAVQRMAERLEQAGLTTRIEEQTACCYAVQTKVWVDDPDGNPWEIFVVLDAEAEQRSNAGAACCAGPESPDRVIASQDCC